MTKLGRQQAEAMQNHENEHGRGELGKLTTV
jgi:hypothetical protein